MSLWLLPLGAQRKCTFSVLRIRIWERNERKLQPVDNGTWQAPSLSGIMETIRHNCYHLIINVPCILIDCLL